MNSHKLKRVLQKGDIHLAYISRLYLLALLILVEISFPSIGLFFLSAILSAFISTVVFILVLMEFIKLGYKQKKIKYTLLVLCSSALLFCLYSLNRVEKEYSCSKPHIIELYGCAASSAKVGHYNENALAGTIYEVPAYMGLALLILYITNLLLDRVVKFKRLFIAIGMIMIYLSFIGAYGYKSPIILVFPFIFFLYYLLIRCKFYMVFAVAITIIIAIFLMFIFHGTYHMLYVLLPLLLSIIIYTLFRKNRYLKKIYTSKLFYFYVLLYIPFTFLLAIFCSYFDINGLFHFLKL